MPKPLTEPKIKKILALYKIGLSARKVGMELGITKSTVLRRLKRHGVSRRSTSDYRGQRIGSRLNKGKLFCFEEEIIIEYKSGKSCEQVSKIYHCTPAAILYILKKNKCETRSKTLIRSSKQKRYFGRKVTLKQEKQIIHLYENGETWKLICEKFIISYGGLCKILDRNNVPRRGVSIQTKIALSAFAQGIPVSEWTDFRKSENLRERQGRKYSVWCNAVKDRDGWQCQDCGKYCEKKPDSILERLEAHHLVPFALNKSLRYEVSNGLSLCFWCHRKAEVQLNKLLRRRKN